MQSRTEDEALAQVTGGSRKFLDSEASAGNMVLLSAHRDVVVRWTVQFHRLRGGEDERQVFDAWESGRSVRR